MLISGRLRPFIMAGFVLAATAIVVGSLYPSLQLPGVDQGLDLGFHAMAYSVLVILGGALWNQLRWVAVIVFAYSALLEGLQYFVPGREVHLSDMAANALGVFAGLAIVALWHSRQVAPGLDNKVL